MDAGVPEGGQFTATAHAEPTLTLSAADVRRETAALLAKYTNENDLYDMASRAAAYHQATYNQKAKSQVHGKDDIVQETVAQVLVRLRTGQQINDFPQLVNSIAANVTVRFTQNKFRAEDRRAYREFTKKCDALSLQVGRSLTQIEEDALAQQVLDEWHDPRHKPSKDFRTPHTIDASLDRTFGDGDGVESTLGATLVAPESTGNYIQPGSYMDQAFTLLDMKGAANKAAAKRMGWNAIAEAGGIPLSREGSLSQRSVTTLRGVMDDHEGGVLKAARDWSLGNDNAATEALFAPFGDLDFEQQEKVIDLIERLDDKADDMWRGALAYANNKHAGS